MTYTLQMSESHTLIAEFSFDGEPVSKARARFTKGGRSYTPATTKAAEALVADAFREAVPEHSPNDSDAYRVETVFLCGTRQRRDVDNMVKLVFDGLNGVAWADDVQVVEVHAIKTLVDPEKASTIVRLWVVGEVDRRTSTCEFCGEEYPTYASWKGVRRFCSATCRIAERRERRQRVCINCAVEYITGDPNSKYCSRPCASEHRTVTLICAYCGEDMKKPRSLANKGKPFCCGDHRVAYWREHRAKVAVGTCARCGGATSKKSYTHCMSCSIEDRREKRGETSAG